jgi:integrase
MAIKSYKKKDGKTYYMFQVDLPSDPLTGKRRQVCRRGFKTRSEASIAMGRILSGGEKKDYTKSTYQSVYEIWAPIYKETVKESAYQKTTSHFRNHILPALGEYRVAAVTPQIMQGAVNDWAKKLVGYRKVLNYASAVFKHAMRLGMIKTNPCDLILSPKGKTSPKEDNPDDNYYTKEELEEFLSIAEEGMSDRWYTFFRLLAYTGMRRGEALALTWEDVDFKANQIEISKNLTLGINYVPIIQEAKTESGKRVIDIDLETMKILKSWKSAQRKELTALGHGLKIRGQLVFNAPRSNGTLSLPQAGHRLDALYKKHNLKRITPHGFRHTHCSILFEAGATIPQVQKRLGHKDIRTTMNIYNHVTRKKQQETVEIFTNYMSM